MFRESGFAFARLPQIKILVRQTAIPKPELLATFPMPLRSYSNSAECLALSDEYCRERSQIANAACIHDKAAIIMVFESSIGSGSCS